MCRWLVYSGSPLLLDDILYKPEHSLIDQSLSAKRGPHTTNGDGFGVGWYGTGSSPILYRGGDPLWNDNNLRELATEIRSHLVFAHVRASTGTPVQQSNCHPFRYRNWLWMHNGQIERFAEIKRELVLAVDPALYPCIQGSTDTETFFYLALSLGLENDPPGAVERAVGFIEQVASRHGIEDAMRMSVAASNGENTWVFRYASAGEPPSLFFSTEVEALRAMYPDMPWLRELSADSMLVVSEPLADLPGAWNEVPASSWRMIGPGRDEWRPFEPRLA